jgi:hypothetical protein
MTVPSPDALALTGIAFVATFGAWKALAPRVATGLSKLVVKS